MLPVVVCYSKCLFKLKTPGIRQANSLIAIQTMLTLLLSGISDMHYSGPDLEDVRESVRQGVTKVAGRLSSLASGVMSSLQDKYGG